MMLTINRLYAEGLPMIFPASMATSGMLSSNTLAR
jgi:hypothetical protein